MSEHAISAQEVVYLQAVGHPGSVNRFRVPTRKGHITVCLNFTPTVVGAADLPARGSLTVTGSLTTRENMLSHTEAHIYRRRPYAADAYPGRVRAHHMGRLGAAYRALVCIKNYYVLIYTRPKAQGIPAKQLFAQALHLYGNSSALFLSQFLICFCRRFKEKNKTIPRPSLS